VANWLFADGIEKIDFGNTTSYSERESPVLGSQFSWGYTKTGHPRKESKNGWSTLQKRKGQGQYFRIIYFILGFWHIEI
jgi:hypothetical protein